MNWTLEQQSLALQEGWGIVPNPITASFELKAWLQHSKPPFTVDQQAWMHVYLLAEEGNLYQQALRVLQETNPEYYNNLAEYCQAQVASLNELRIE